jgi:hypothetical protein
MNSFFRKLKIVFEKIPIKANFLKDLGFNISYSGFRYFMQGRKDLPSKDLLNRLCSEMNYEYITIPIKLDEKNQHKKQELEDQFFLDINTYLSKYKDDQMRIYAKEFGTESSVAKAISAFSEEEIKPDDKIDLSDIF